jgi:predicted nuclease with RNAse H fold
MVRGVRTVGIDLAAEPRGTAVALVDWADGHHVTDGHRVADGHGVADEPRVADGARVVSVTVGCEDAVVVAACAEADFVGIDCPLGWPVPFVRFVRDHTAGRPPAVDPAEPRWRQPLVLRQTDRACIEYTRAATGRAVRPLSVSADLLGHVAMRCVVLQHRLRVAGIPVDRTGGTGRVAEVYPAATLALWGVAARSYKGAGRRAELAAVVAALRRQLPWLSWSGPATALCDASDHALDAVVAALAARAVAVGRATRPSTPAELDRAPAEGWIALPTCPPGDLL